MVLNTVLYLVWIGVPVIVFVIVLFRGITAKVVGEEAPQDDLSTPSSAVKFDLDSRLKDLLAAVMIAATITLLVDNLLIPTVEFRRLVYWSPLLHDVIRVLLFPCALVVGRSLAIAIAFVRPPQVDARFERDIKGISPLWAALGFGAALFTFNYRDGTAFEQVGPSMSLSRFDVAEQDAAANVVDGEPTPTPLEVQYAGSEYNRYQPLIAEAADEHDIPLATLVALIAEESNFNADFRGPSGGIGLMNVTVSMARELRINDHAQIRNNLKIGCLTLNQLRKRFGNSNPRLWIAAYHFGAEMIAQNPSVTEEPGDVKEFVDAVMRKSDPATDF